VDACGAPCVDFPDDEETPGGGPPDGLNALHRALTRWASSYFETRPAPNPWNSLAKVMIDAGADALAPTRAKAAETPLHLAVAKRNVEGAAMLLESLGAEGRRAALGARDGLGFSPLAVSAAWKNWAVAIPRLLARNGAAAAGGEARGAAAVVAALRTQALDGAAAACAAPIAAAAARGPRGPSARAVSDALARCGFYGALPGLLLDVGADPDARDARNRTFFYDLHPALLEDAGTPSTRRAKASVDRALARLPTGAAAALLAESAGARHAWHAAPANRSLPLLRADAPGNACDDAVATEYSPADLGEAVAAGRPALFRGALAGDASWDGARALWGDAAALARSHGRAVVRAGAFPRRNQSRGKTAGPGYLPTPPSRPNRTRFP